MKKSKKILLYGLIISIVYIILCIFIEKEEFINKAESLVSENLIESPKRDNSQNMNKPSKEIESIEEEIKPSKEEDTLHNINNNLIEDKNIVNSDSDIDSNREIEDDIEVAQNKVEEILKEKKINFYRNRSKMIPESKDTLKEIISIIKDIPNIKIYVKGYTDASGKRDVNRWISEARAKSVKLYLGSHGINPDIIDYKGFGEDNLLYKDKPYSPLNRRVEIEIKRR